MEVGKNLDEKFRMKRWDGMNVRSSEEENETMEEGR